jgi:hypothetical protein
MRTLISSCLLFCAGLAQAAHDPVVACRTAHENDAAAHIACLENALRSRDPAATGTAIPAATAAKSAGSAAEPSWAPAATAASATVTRVSATTAAGATSASLAAASPPAAPTGLGAEQAKAQQRGPSGAPESVAVRIVGVRYNTEGIGYFTMADGQLWTETVRSPERVHLDADKEYDARLEASKIGGYRLYVDGVRWMHKVKRLK